MAMKSLGDVRDWAASVGLDYTRMHSGFDHAYQLSLDVGTRKMILVFVDADRREFITQANIFRGWIEERIDATLP